MASTTGGIEGSGSESYPNRYPKALLLLSFFFPSIAGFDEAGIHVPLIHCCDRNLRGRIVCIHRKKIVPVIENDLGTSTTMWVEIEGSEVVILR